MEINDYIKITENSLTKSNLKSLMKIVQEINYDDAKIFDEENEIVKRDVRKVKERYLDMNSTSMTEWHWLNYLGRVFMDGNIDYYNKFNMQIHSHGLLNISILKYENTGHYNFHVDAGKYANRTLSMILLLNDDYEGGDLLFRDVAKNKEIKIPKKAGNLIVWPSNFMFPHCVTPVTKGVRYSVVSWAV